MPGASRLQRCGKFPCDGDVDRDAIDRPSAIRGRRDLVRQASELQQPEQAAVVLWSRPNLGRRIRHAEFPRGARLDEQTDRGETAATKLPPPGRREDRRPARWVRFDVRQERAQRSQLGVSHF